MAIETSSDTSIDALGGDPATGPAREAFEIALVDDDRNILTTVSIALQAEGFVTRLYSDGETALKALLENPPDLAVFDIKMPKIDGIELLRRVREHSPLPVIFLTSKDDEADEEAGLELGADDYIAKPFSLRLLTARIRAILRRAEPERVIGNETSEPAPSHPKIDRGRLHMDPARHYVTWDDKSVIFRGPRSASRRHQKPQPIDGRGLSRRCFRR